MGWLIALGILILLALFPLGVSMKYNWQGFRLWVLAGPVRISLLPSKKKEKKQKKEKTTEESEKKTKKSHARTYPEGPEAEKKGGSVLDFLPLAKIGLEMLNSFRRKLRVNRLDLEVKLAGDDPCDLAVNYGRACGALDNLLALLDRAFVIKKRHTWIGCDFEADQTLVYARLDLTITLGRLVGLLVYHGLRALRAYLNLMNLRKGGTSQ